MIETRRDLSAWVLHFVHDRNPENDPAFNINEGDSTPLFPFHEDQDQNQRFELWEMVDEHSTLAPDDSALCVLLKILEDGHIRSGWSFRGGRPTIYGPRSAVCLTEMPLYALIDYAQRRGKESVGAYAIGLLRDELYASGGRPVIYGLSGPHVEQVVERHGPFAEWHWPRKLDASCGLSDREQYRYVATQLDGKRKRTDWTHEREWRWADVADACSCPGLPIWLKDSPHRFSRVIVVVPTRKEANRILDQLKEQYDAKGHNFDYEYDLETLRATKVIALEDVAGAVSPEKLLTIRIEDIPASSIKVFSSPPASAAYLAEVKRVLGIAHEAAKVAAADFYAKAPKSKEGFVLDSCGFAHLTLYSPQSPLATALLQIGEATVIGGVGYWISDFGKYGTTTQSLTMAEEAVEAAKSVFKDAFPECEFGTDSRFD